MSVLIKGMEMPKSCDVCCFVLFVESCPLYNATPEDLVGITWIKKARHRYCPLVPVPPHGRLIDADALQMEAHKRLMMCNKNNNQIHKPYEMMKAIVCAPTIIEAEEEER